MPIEPHPERLLEVYEVANLWRVSHETVLRRIRARQLHAIRFGSQWRIRPVDVKAFEDANHTANGNGNGNGNGHAG